MINFLLNLSKFKKNLFLYLSSIENLFCVVILANSIVVLVETIFIWIKSRSINIAVVDSLDWLFISVVVITSGIIAATFRTLNHILINFIVNVTHSLYTYYKCYYAAKFSSSITFVVLQAIFLLLILLIVAIWTRRKDTFRKSLFVIFNSNRIMDTEIKEIYKWYHLQLTLCHAQILVAIFSQITYLYLMMTKNYYNVRNPFELLKHIPWPSILLCIIAIIMIKGVREESTLIMIIFYISNCILFIYYIYALEITINLLKIFGENLILGRKISIVLDIISIFITTITMINSIICHKNFGKGLKDYLLKEELEPFKESYNYEDDLDDYHERT